MMNSMEKFCLKWTEFDINIREYFKKLRNDHQFFDVTLATEDGQYLQAHKLILSAASKFFSNIFMENNHPNMLVYLKGINSEELHHIADFIYNGEASVTHEELITFLKTGKELKVKGIMDDMKSMSDNDQNDKFRECSELQYQDVDYKEVVNQEFTVVEHLPSQEFADAKLKTNSVELDFQIKEMIEKQEDIWRCKVCGKTTPNRFIIKNHAETHIDGMSHNCRFCGKIFANRHCLQVHVSNIHSKLFSCDLCRRSGMNRKAYYMHNQKYHKY